jgi:hypothetical protein
LAFLYREVVIVNKKGILKRLVLVLALGLLLILAGNVNAGLVTLSDGSTAEATFTFEPDDDSLWDEEPGDGAGLVVTVRVFEKQGDTNFGGTSTFDPANPDVPTDSYDIDTGVPEEPGFTMGNYLYTYTLTNNSDAGVVTFSFGLAGIDLTPPNTVGDGAPFGAGYVGDGMGPLEEPTLTPSVEANPLFPGPLQATFVFLFGISGNNSSALLWLSSDIGPEDYTLNPISTIAWTGENDEGEAPGFGITSVIEGPSVIGKKQDPLTNNIPEPATLLLLGSGLLASGIFRRRISKRINAKE